jgi:hypothetical protein
VFQNVIYTIPSLIVVLLNLHLSTILEHINYNIMPEEKRCNCGDTDEQFYPDENQWEPNCWDCYYQLQEKREEY